MKELRKYTGFDEIGSSLVDYKYYAMQELLLDDGHIVMLYVALYPSGEKEYAIKYLHSKIFDTGKKIASFRTLRDTKETEYYKYFVRLNARVNSKRRKNLKMLDDTKYCGGIRTAAKVDKTGLTTYCEAVTYLSKENKYIYLQVIENNEKYKYSVTEKSIFLRMYLDDLYKVYYKKEEVSFVIKTDDLNDLGELSYLLPDFEDMKERINKEFKTKK